jgi:hypothetical protein
MTQDRPVEFSAAAATDGFASLGPVASLGGAANALGSVTFAAAAAGGFACTH